MKPISKPLIVALATLCFFGVSHFLRNNSHPADKIISVASEDIEMNDAIAKARASLDTFWAAQKSAQPGQAGFALKVRIQGNGESEHFWLVDVEHKETGYVGTINNDPESVKTVVNGQRYEFKDDQISDWMFTRKGKLVGNETLRPLMKHMPEKEAAFYRAILETP